MLKIKITENQVGISPKNFLKKNLDIVPIKIWELIKKRKILINNLPIKKNYRFKMNDEIQINFDVKLKVKKVSNEKKNLHCETIFENKDFIVLNKLSNIIVSNNTNQENFLKLHLNFLGENFTHTHRLDKNTTGAILIAKNQISLRDFNLKFKNREIKKKYLCIVLGNFTKKEDIIKLGIDFSKSINKKMEINKNGKSSITKYKVLKEFEKNGENFSLLEIDLMTGYTHQIRVVMSYLKHPVLGDNMYGNSYINNLMKVETQLLHSHILEFEYKGENYKIKCEIENEFGKFC